MSLKFFVASVVSCGGRCANMFNMFSIKWTILYDIFYLNGNLQALYSLYIDKFCMVNYRKRFDR